MKDEGKTKEQLINELVGLRRRLVELETSEVERKRMDEALQEAHDKLERRVEEGTAELLKANEQLKREIAERKLAEEALRRSEEKFKSLTETTTDWVWEVNTQGVYTYASPKVKDLLGYEVREVLGKTPFDLMPKEEAKRISKFFNERVMNKEPFHGLENTNRHKDGHLVVLETNGIPTLNEKGQLKGYRGIDRDITERKRAEDQLRDSEERLALALDASNSGMWDFNPHIFTDTHYNDRWFTMLGYEPDELPHTAETWTKLMHPEDSERVQKKLQDHIEKKSPYSAEFRMKTKDGRYRWVHSIGKIVSWDNEGNPKRMIGIHVDINDRKEAEAKRKKLEAQLQQGEKLEVIGTLAAGVGHELRNPLGAIKNAAYFLNMALEEPEAEVKEALEILEKEVVTSERTISSLLDFAGSRPPTRRKVDINDVVRAALSCSRGPVPENIEVVSQLDEAVPAILADPYQLAQIFGNLILNAIQAMSTCADGAAGRRDGGRLVVKSEQPASEWVAVSFADTGAGIAEEELGKVFEPMFTTKAKGIGLGLALSKTLVEAHGGTIEVESDLGKGSTFTVRLPVGLTIDD